MKISGPGHRRERGYVLTEAMVGGVVMLLAVTSLMGALSQASALLGKATADQEAALIVVEQMEGLRALPASSTRWNAGVTACPGVFQAGWNCTVTVTDVSDPDVGGPVSGALSYKRGVVRVDYRDTSLSMEVLKW